METTNLELELWQLKAVLLQTQQALMHYQAKEVQENLQRIKSEVKEDK